jgi:hypothetical protein
VYIWAAASNGKVSVHDSSTLQFASELDSYSQIKFTPLKRTERAIEKLQRSYSQDVSRLVDVVRQSIVFTNLEDLCTCLKVISRDSNTRNLRVKNRYSRDFDARTTGGYRDVAVNLVIETQETLELGVNGHVCELQLLLVQFHRLKTEDGHKRYVEYRNLRAE